MEQILKDYLAAAKSNLERYEALGDENAIRAGKGMVAAFEADLAKLKGAK